MEILFSKGSHPYIPLFRFSDFCWDKESPPSFSKLIFLRPLYRGNGLKALERHLLGFSFSKQLKFCTIQKNPIFKIKNFNHSCF
jgi:hypothetical protein